MFGHEEIKPMVLDNRYGLDTCSTSIGKITEQPKYSMDYSVEQTPPFSPDEVELLWNAMYRTSKTICGSSQPFIFLDKNTWKQISTELHTRGYPRRPWSQLRSKGKLLLSAHSRALASPGAPDHSSVQSINAPLTYSQNPEKHVPASLPNLPNLIPSPHAAKTNIVSSTQAINHFTESFGRVSNQNDSVAPIMVAPAPPYPNQDPPGFNIPSHWIPVNPILTAVPNTNIQANAVINPSPPVIVKPIEPTAPRSTFSEARDSAYG